MLRENPEVDLHVHSYYSDGIYSPRRVAMHAKMSGLKAVCLTDHDNHLGLDQFIAACCEEEIDTLSGIEITTSYNDTDIHILGYGIDLTQDEYLCQKLQPHWEMRNRRAEMILEKYAKAGVMVTDLRYVQQETCCVAPYVPSAKIVDFRLERCGLPRETIRAESKRGGFAYVPYITDMLMTPVEVVEFIKSLGGQAVLAHPGDILKRTIGRSDRGLKTFFALLDILKDAGLFGLEAYWSGHTEHHNRFFAEVARKRDLFVTGGSDYHGKGYNDKIGMCGISYEEFLKLKEACARR